MTTTSAADAHKEQLEFWNGIGGAKWLAAQEHLDAMLAPVSQVLLERAKPGPGSSILDIGCGCGATSIDLAKAVGASGRVLAVDVSRPLLECARARLRAYPQAEAILADASTFAFSPFADLAVSRFGVMFFGDPNAGFANIRRAIKANGRLVFACWRDFDANPWMKVPLVAAYRAGLPPTPSPGPEDPGPFSFANPERVTRILTAAGFAPPEFFPVDLALDLAAEKGLAAAVAQTLLIGPTSRALRDQPETMVEIVRRAVEDALRPHCEGTSVKLGAAIWLVESRPA